MIFLQIEICLHVLIITPLSLCLYSSTLHQTPEQKIIYSNIWYRLCWFTKCHFEREDVQTSAGVTLQLSRIWSQFSLSLSTYQSSPSEERPHGHHRLFIETPKTKINFPDLSSGAWSKLVSKHITDISNSTLYSISSTFNIIIESRFHLCSEGFFRSNRTSPGPHLSDGLNH